MIDNLALIALGAFTAWRTYRWGRSDGWHEARTQQHTVERLRREEGSPRPNGVVVEWRLLDAEGEPLEKGWRR